MELNHPAAAPSSLFWPSLAALSPQTLLGSLIQPVAPNRLCPAPQPPSLCAPSWPWRCSAAPLQPWPGQLAEVRHHDGKSVQGGEGGAMEVNASRRQIHGLPRPHPAHCSLSPKGRARHEGRGMVINCHQTTAAGSWSAVERPRVLPPHPPCPLLPHPLLSQHHPLHHGTLLCRLCRVELLAAQRR